jgi:hypothetical protein
MKREDKCGVKIIYKRRIGFQSSPRMLRHTLPSRSILGW